MWNHPHLIARPRPRSIQRFPAMAWPYHILDLSTEQKHLRRELLDRYGVYAQLSALIPILAYQLYRLLVWVYSERQRSRRAYFEVPSSPVSKHARRSSSGAATKKWRSMMWWLEGEVAPGWGLRNRWIAGTAWTSWLLFLCIHRTGDGMYSSRLHWPSQLNCRRASILILLHP